MSRNESNIALGKDAEVINYDKLSSVSGTSDPKINQYQYKNRVDFQSFHPLTINSHIIFKP